MHVVNRPIVSQIPLKLGLALVFCGSAACGLRADETGQVPDWTSPVSVAAEVDRLINSELEATRIDPAPTTSDEDFLRRVTFDLAGTVPSPDEVTLFGLDPDEHKRANRIDGLVGSPEYARNWARYWRDVIFSRATEQRAVRMQGTFEDWMTKQLEQNRGWDEIATSLITATGNIQEAGETALMYAHAGNAEEIAAEASRIFLGIQIQCANCHDHPSDKWKRKDFHELAAYFPRVTVRRVRDSKPRTFEVVSMDSVRDDRRSALQDPESLMARLDADRDGRITRTEIGDRPLARLLNRALERGDLDKDDALSLDELQKLRPPNNPRRGSAEHFMPDLNDPASRGTRVNPALFVDGERSKVGLDDLERRRSLAQNLTSPRNRWFAKAFVNRIWTEMLGEGFYTPVDDMGPQRSASYPDVMELLATGFVANNYDMQWLFRVVANTQAYQRQIRAADAADDAPFAAAAPTRLRADQLYTAIVKVMGLEGPDAEGPEGKRNRRLGAPRSLFAALFEFDPSTPQDDIVGTIPQALFMMNSSVINRMIRGEGNTSLGRILAQYDKDDDAVSELYLLTLSREPSDEETRVCLDYVRDVGNRNEAFEDILWSLLNSSEFLSRR